MPDIPTHIELWRCRKCGDYEFKLTAECPACGATWLKDDGGNAQVEHVRLRTPESEAEFVEAGEALRQIVYSLCKDDFRLTHYLAACDRFHRAVGEEE